VKLYASRLPFAAKPTLLPWHWQIEKGQPETPQAKFLAACPVLSPKLGLNKEWAAIVQDSDKQSCPVQKSSEL